MDILDILVKLRDDLKTWVTNNILALKEEIDRSKFSGEYEDLFGKPDIDNKIEIAIEPLENELNSKLENKANKDELFSGDYNDLINKPVIPTADDLLSDEQKAQISTAYDHSQVAHAPANAQKNSDITKAEIEEKLVGEIDSHSHAPLSYEEIINAPDILEDGSGDINFVDEAGNIIVTIDSNGIHTTNIVADDSITGTSASINNISTNSLEIDGVNILTTVDSKISAKFTEIDELLDEITDEEIDAIIASLDE